MDSVLGLVEGGGMTEDVDGVDVEDGVSVDGSIYLDDKEPDASWLIGTWFSEIPLKFVQYWKGSGSPYMVISVLSNGNLRDWWYVDGTNLKV